MNRVHRTVWSSTRDAFVAVSEITTGQGKGSRRGAATSGGGLLPFGLLITGIAAALQPVHALPLNGQVTNGNASVTQSAASTTIQQNSQTATLNWSSFNIGRGESVVFRQPGAGAIALNRIADTSASQILGALTANGQIFLVNPNGILFGSGAQLNVGGLVASTLDIADSALSQPDKVFAGTGKGRIDNFGRIKAGEGGYVAFIGNQVGNQGSIEAARGTVAMGAGEQVTLRFDQTRLLGLAVDRNTLGNLADNQQLIQADGGRVILSAGARDSVLAGVVNNSGVVQARTVENHNGVITLGAGQVFQAGTLDAGAPAGGDAGSSRVEASAVLDAGRTEATSASGRGGQVTLTADGGLVQTSQARVSASGAVEGGRITVQGHNVFSSATLQANGTGAGASGGRIDMLAQ